MTENHVALLLARDFDDDDYIDALLADCEECAECMCALCTERLARWGESMGVDDDSE